MVAVVGRKQTVPTPQPRQLASVSLVKPCRTPNTRESARLSYKHQLDQKSGRSSILIWSFDNMVRYSSMHRCRRGSTQKCSGLSGSLMLLPRILVRVSVGQKRVRPEVQRKRETPPYCLSISGGRRVGLKSETITTVRVVPGTCSGVRRVTDAALPLISWMVMPAPLAWAKNGSRVASGSLLTLVL